VFDWAFSPSNVTRRSIPTMVTGLAPNRVRGRVVGWALRVDPRHVLVAERLAAGGYDTAGFMCCKGFWGDEFHTGLQRGLDHLEIEMSGVELARRARQWVEERDRQHPSKPLFLWMHVIEPHNWAVGPGEGRNEQERKQFYDRSLATSDAALGELLNAFSHRDPGKAPIVIVTADHGEGLGDHGHPFHSTDLYDSQTHVPLVVAGPGVRTAHVGETVSLTDLVPTIERILRQTGFNPTLLELELTESVLIESDQQNIDALAQLSAMGIRLAIDDFGTGYSSFIYLKRYPIASIKIDRAFVRDVTVDPNDAAITQSLIAMAQNLRMNVVAEGVETQEQCGFLSEHGCHLMQGYYFSAPLPADALVPLLEKRSFHVLKAA